jgi:hypothetical protein
MCSVKGPNMGIEKNVFEVKLFVKGEKVAESTDVKLWQAVFAAISRSSEEGSVVSSGLLFDGLLTDAGQIDDPVVKLAKEIGIDVSTLRGACDTRKAEPYLHLDMHCWGEWRKNVPERGPTAVSTTAIAATLLCLWFRSAGLGNPTLQQSLKVLSNIGAKGNNPSRSVKKCSWLQPRGGQTLQLNPAAIERAVEVAKAFCEKRPPQFKLHSK